MPDPAPTETSLRDKLHVQLEDEVAAAIRSYQEATGDTVRWISIEHYEAGSFQVSATIRRSVESR